MNQKRLWTAAGIIALVIFLVFALSAPRARDDDVPQQRSGEATSTPVVIVHDTFKKGLHTITGSLEAPNACSIISATATTTEESIRVAISVQTDSQRCLQLPARKDFSTTVVAPPRLPITATVNGVLATTTPS